MRIPSMTKNSKIALRALIKRDIKRINESNAVSIQAKSDLLDSIAEMMQAIEDFKEEAPGAAVTNIAQLLNDLQEKLVDMSTRPDSFIMTSKQPVKKVSLKPAEKVM